MKNTRLAVIVCAVYLTADFSRETLYAIDAYAEFVKSLPRLFRYLEQPLRWSAILALALILLHRVRPRELLKEVGLAAPIVPAFVFAFIVTLPMLIPPLVVSKFARDLDPLYLLFSALLWPLAEEVLFRGYVFRQLHRRAGWNLWAAAAFSGALFGLAHLVGSVAVQQQPLMGQLGTVAMLGGLSVLGAWLFARWNDNLWVLVFLHAFMNLWWAVFELADNPLGGLWANVLRLMTVVLGIVLTIFREPLFRILRLNAIAPEPMNTKS